MHEYRPFLSR